MTAVQALLEGLDTWRQLFLVSTLSKKLQQGLGLSDLDMKQKQTFVCVGTDVGQSSCDRFIQFHYRDFIGTSWLE